MVGKYASAIPYINNVLVSPQCLLLTYIVNKMTQKYFNNIVSTTLNLINHQSVEVI